MTEVLISVSVFLLAALGIGLGLVLGRSPAKTSCGASECLPEGPCSTCPLRHRREQA